MEDGRYWQLIERAWHQVDGGAICAALARSELPAPAELVAGFRRFVLAMLVRLEELPLEEARDTIDRHRTLVRDLDAIRTASAIGAWVYDDSPDRPGDAIAVIDLLGEAFYGRVASGLDSTELRQAAEPLRAIGGWQVVAGPVSARWRRSLLESIPDCFADVAYPGDADVTSGDWVTTEECRYFCGKDWRTLDRRTLHRRHANLSFFSAAGLHYLLPAFLMAALEDTDGSQMCGISIPELLLFKLSRGYMRRSIVLFSPAQREALASFLRFHYERWDRGPFVEHDADLRPALDALDPSKPFIRRPYRRR